MPPDLTVFNGEVLFNGVDAASDNGLWITNGTAAGTHELTGISGASPGGLDPSSFAVINNEVLFRGFDTNGQSGLWVTNGTSKGTHELSPISGAAALFGGLTPTDLAAVALRTSTALLTQAIAGFSPAGSSSIGGQIIDQTADPTHLIAPPH